MKCCLEQHYSDQERELDVLDDRVEVVEEKQDGRMEKILLDVLNLLVFEHRESGKVYANLCQSRLDLILMLMLKFERFFMGNSNE